MAPLLLDARELTKRFQGLVSVDHVSFSMAKGEIVAVIGPNGAGKTTLVNLISGSLSLDDGQLYFDGNRIDSLPPFRRARLGIGRTFQVMKPFPGLTALDNVAVGALFGYEGGEPSREIARRQARGWLAFTGLAERADQRADALGGPDRKRLELAKALALRPKLLLLDEVMAGLNAVEIDEVVRLIRQIREQGVTIVVIEHVMRAVRQLADRVIVLHHGQKIAEGDTGTVFEDPKVVEAYLGKEARMSANGSLLRAAGLSAGYGSVPVLFDVDFVVQPGEIVTLVGSNGAGKTTLLRAMSRVIDATGTLEFEGNDILGLTPEEVFSRGLVQVPEGRQLFGGMTAEENLLVGAHKRSDKAAIATSFAWVYELFPFLAQRRRQLAGSMSGGEQQMCALARGLMAAPRLLAIDEMSLGLAPVIVDQLIGVLGEIRKQGVAIFLVEQDVFAALSVADRGYVMETGRIVKAGTAAELSGDPAVRAAYLGFDVEA